MGVTITPLPGCGAEIGGVDLARPISEEDFVAIRAAYAGHGVIFFRDQDVTEEQHIAFARRWAPIDINRFLAAHPRYPEIAVLKKERDQTENIGGAWHTDHSYDQIPAMGSILVARQLPPTGGNTLFSSMYAAYDALSPAMKEELAPLQAVHSAKQIFGKGAFYGKERGDRIGNSDAADALTDSVHPVIITHPLSGKKAIFVNIAYTTQIVGWTQERTREFLDEMFVHCTQPQFVYEFEWRTGSVAFWDNRSTWHYAKNDYHGYRREMHRITLAGEALEGAA